MIVAYADPPYPGCAGMYPENEEVDHEALVAWLDNFDGWALSTSSPALADVLRVCPVGVRVMAWVKPFCSFKPGVNPAYAWEPVIVSPARSLGRDVNTVRDWVSSNITLQRGLTGAKPAAFALWLFDVLGLVPRDTFVDVFPGTGAVTDAWLGWSTRHDFGVLDLGLQDIQ